MFVPKEGDLPDEARQEAIGFVQSALNALSAHVAILDHQGEILGVNRAWERFAQDNGLSDHAQGLGINYLAVCDTSARLNSPGAAEVGQGIRDVMTLRQDEFYLEYPCHGPKVKRWFVVRVSRFEWFEQALYIVAHQNVTELKQVQIELGENQQRLQAIFDTVANGIVILDAQGRIETANPAAAQIFGGTMETMVGQSFDTFLKAPVLITDLQANRDYEKVGKRQDGSTFPMYMAMAQTQLGGGLLFTVVIQDITDRKRVEAELVEKEKLQVALEKERELSEFRSRFMSTVSHELRTPLTVIQLSYDTITTYADRTPESEKAEALTSIKSQVDYLTDLVTDVMTISKAESHQLEFNPQKRDLLTYCRGVVEEFQLAYHKTYPIHFDTNCMRLEAMVDAKLFRQVLNNLLANAIKYSPDGGEVGFELHCEEQRATIRVSDQGIGIPPEDMVDLFEPFRRASNVGELPGSGLGLAIAREAIELHRGTIQVESKIGVGTTLTLDFPILGAEILTDESDWWE